MYIFTVNTANVRVIDIPCENYGRSKLFKKSNYYKIPLISTVKYFWKIRLYKKLYAFSIIDILFFGI